MVGVARSSKSHITHTAHTFSSLLTLSRSLSRGLLTVLSESGNVKIFSEKRWGGQDERKKRVGAWKCNATLAASRCVADVSGRPERLTGTNLASVRCDMTLSPLPSPGFDVSAFHGS